MDKKEKQMLNKSLDELVGEFWNMDCLIRVMKELLSNDNCLSQLIIDVISAILDGYSTAVPAAGHYGDRLTTVAAQREQESVELFVIGFDGADDVFLSFFRLQ